MAQQTKARQKPKARSRGSTGKASKSSAAKSRKATASKPRSASRSRSSSNGSGKVETARHAVEGTAKDAGHSLGSAASKAGHAASRAKVPLLAGGAALAGAAGGLALGTRQSRRHGLGSMVPRRPQVKVRSQDLAKAAKEVGSFGAQVGRLASELQQAREATSNGKHRSPVEVVLEGLTARRSRT